MAHMFRLGLGLALSALAVPALSRAHDAYAESLVGNTLTIHGTTTVVSLPPLPTTTVTVVRPTTTYFVAPAASASSPDGSASLPSEEGSGGALVPLTINGFMTTITVPASDFTSFPSGTAPVTLQPITPILNPAPNANSNTAATGGISIHETVVTVSQATTVRGPSPASTSTGSSTMFAPLNGYGTVYVVSTTNSMGQPTVVLIPGADGNGGASTSVPASGSTASDSNSQSASPASGSSASAALASLSSMASSYAASSMASAAHASLSSGAASYSSSLASAIAGNSSSSYATSLGGGNATTTTTTTGSMTTSVTSGNSTTTGTSSSSSGAAPSATSIIGGPTGITVTGTATSTVNGNGNGGNNGGTETSKAGSSSTAAPNAGARSVTGSAWMGVGAGILGMAVLGGVL